MTSSLAFHILSTNMHRWHFKIISRRLFAQICVTTEERKESQSKYNRKVWWRPQIKSERNVIHVFIPHCHGFTWWRWRHHEGVELHLAAGQCDLHTLSCWHHQLLHCCGEGHVIRAEVRAGSLPHQGSNMMWSDFTPLSQLCHNLPLHCSDELCYLQWEYQWWECKYRNNVYKLLFIFLRWWMTEKKIFRFLKKNFLKQQDL